MPDDVLPFFLGVSESVTSSLEDTKFSYENLFYFLIGKEMIYTYIFFILSSIIYFLIRRSYVKKGIDLVENQRHADDNDDKINDLKIKMVFLRNFFIVFIFIGIVFIWKDEIKTTFFSISFAIMAIVVLFKEFLQNILSSILVSVNGMYKIGDVIEVKGRKGSVVDRTMFNTKLILKVDGLNSGQEYIVPNSHFLNNETVLHTRFGNYSIQFLEVFIDKKRHLPVASKALKEAAEEITLNTKGRGDRLNNWRKKIKKDGLDAPSHKPFVTMHPSDKPYLTLKYVCDLRYAFIVRQEILEKFFALFPIMVHEYEENLKKEMAELFNIPVDNSTENVVISNEVVENVESPQVNKTNEETVKATEQTKEENKVEVNKDGSTNKK